MNDDLQFSEILYDGIEKNEYLNKLYEAIIFNNLIKGLQLSINEIQFNKEAALSFCDILSKSNHIENKDKHRLMAQEMISLLYKLNPNDIQIKYTAGIILSNLANYRGLQTNIKDFCIININDITFDKAQRRYLSIPFGQGYFFPNQKEIIDLYNSNYLSYSGKTSLGKTFLMLSFIKAQLLSDKKYNYAIVVPSKSLINDIYNDVIDSVGDFLFDKSYTVITTSISPLLDEQNNYIFILTPERLLYLLINKKIKIDYLFIDEAHKISDKEIRSTFYYKVINMVCDINQNCHVIFSSPNIPNPGIYLDLISKSHSLNKTKIDYQSSYSPVSQVNYLINIPEKTISYFNPYLKSFKTIFEINFNFDLNKLIYNASNLETKQTLIYGAKVDEVIDMAENFTKYLTNINSRIISDELEELSKQIAIDINPDHFLVKMIKNGIAYHTGKLPTSIRTKIEKLFKDGKIKYLFCTKTLLEGVNLPADNLIVTSYQSGTHNLSSVDFKNLLGRVGRIKFNLFGNIFHIIQEKSQQETFHNLIKKEVPRQTLSVSQQLTNETKDFIIKNLVLGITSLQKPEEMSFDTFQIVQKYTSILLRDIMTDNNSFIVNEFEDFLPINTKVLIKEAFKDKDSLIDDDINTNLDQIISLENAIKNQNLKYPDTIKYETIYNFLLQLSDALLLSKYDPDYIGKNKTALKSHATALNKWMHGNSIREIIDFSINYYLQPGKKLSIKMTKEELAKREENDHSTYKKVTYDKSPEQTNIIINQDLDEIEQTILFSTANYFHRFSHQYRKLKGELWPDWYDYVEYGSNIFEVIQLQQIGFSREVAIAIYKSKLYKLKTVNSKRRIYLYPIIKGNLSDSVDSEIEKVSKNIPTLYDI